MRFLTVKTSSMYRVTQLILSNINRNDNKLFLKLI